MNVRRWTNLAAMLLLVTWAATGCDFMNGGDETDPPLCVTDADCVDGGVCHPDSKECVECMLDAHCPLGKKCDGETNLCVGCLADADCPDDLVCASEVHLCVECLADDDCGEGGQCDEEKNICIECVDDADCAYPEAPCAFAACMDGECVTGSVPDGMPCNDGDPCTLGDQCDEGECVAGETDPACVPTGCEAAPDGSPCDDGDPCTLDDLCVAGECLGGPLTPECAGQDIDGDGFTPAEGDCDDQDPAVNPAMDELCGDGVDNDCDGQIDEGCQEECVVSGCSGEICATQEMASDCEWLPQYECLKFSVCGNFAENGGCGWLETDEYLACLEGMCLPEEICGNGLDDDCDGIVDDGCMMGCVDDADCPLGEKCEIFCGNGWCEGQCMPVEPENLCELEGGKCFPLWDDAGEWGFCPDGWAEVDLPGCGEEAICCWDEGPVECWYDDDCPPPPGPCTFAHCVNGTCVYESDPSCGGDDCWGDWMCPGDLYCFFDGCAAETGTCTEMSEFCPEYFSPVCGCDGETYDNICFLQSAGQSLDHEGECGGGQECKDLTDVDFGACAMFMGYGLMNGQCVGISGCGCMDYCDAIFDSMDACKESCMGPPDCGGPCDCYDLYGNDFTDPCPMMCPTCDNYWTCEGGSCMENCGPVPPEIQECVWPCGDEEICGNGIDDDCDGEVDEDCDQPCGGFIGIPCDPGEFCLYPEDTCNWADMMGTCQAIPDGCFFLWDPVCGCNGETYANECLMWQDQMSKFHDGACEVPPECTTDLDCPQPDGPCSIVTCEDGVCVYSVDPNCGGQPCGGFAGLVCPEDQFCLFEEGTCSWADMMGVCMPYPELCPTLWQPVCGCDGETYANECVMWVSGVSMDHEGECGGSPSECEALDPYGYGPCDMVLGYAWDGGDCEVFSGCGCGQDCAQFFNTYSACMDACAPKPAGCAEIDPYAYGFCEMLMGVGFDGEKCVYVSGCGCGGPNEPSCDGLFESMVECENACFGGDTDPGGF